MPLSVWLRMTDPTLLLAPENFAMVERGVYRSAFPRSRNQSFLESLRLRSMVSLVPEDYPAGLLSFYQSHSQSNVHCIWILKIVQISDIFPSELMGTSGRSKRSIVI